MVDGFDLTGKRSLVVGAGLPVGAAVANALAEAGARVAVVMAADSDEAGAGFLRPAATVREGGETPPLRRLTPRIDLAGSGDAGALVRAAIEQLGGLDVVVSCGNLRVAGPFVELTDAEWDRLVAINLTRPMRLFRAAGREMLARGGGRLIQVVSMLGERVLPHTAAYGACQAGLIQLIRALALEWARQNVRVNGIALGWFEGDPLLARTSPEPLLRYLPARRLGHPEEVGALAVYLASDAADMMTGQTIVVDGGVMAHA